MVTSQVVGFEKILSYCIEICTGSVTRQQALFEELSTLLPHLAYLKLLISLWACVVIFLVQLSMTCVSWESFHVLLCAVVTTSCYWIALAGETYFLGKVCPTYSFFFSSWKITIQ